MKKIFLVMDTFTEKTLLLCMDYLIKEVDEIILLRENHTSSKYIEILRHSIKVSVYKMIEDCIDCCDYTLIMQSDKLPQSTIQIVEQLCIKKSKKYYTIKCADKNSKHCSSDYSILPRINSIAIDTPVVLIVPIGDMAIPEYTEILMNKILSANNINFCQYFSPNIASIIEQLNSQHISNCKYGIQETASCNDYDVLVLTFQIESMTEKFFDSLMRIKSYCPDYIILLTDGESSEITTYKYYFQYVCNKKIDLIIRSPYSLVYQDCLIEINNNDSSENIVSMLDRELEKRLKEEVFIKMALPDGVYII